jgi:phosphomethylpyrimidine synthase
MDAAKKGIITREIKIVADKENIDIKKIMELVAAGSVVIPANKNHFSLDPEGIGKGLHTKINVNIGTSADCSSVEKELEKFKMALELGVDAIMDLSSHGKTEVFRKALINTSKAMIGTVPIYDIAGSLGNRELKDISASELLDAVELHASDGVDFMTIHAGINRNTIQKFKNNRRLTNIVSRGGSLLYAWMETTGKENPFYEHYEKLLEIFEKYDVTVSLGDAMRPGSLHDATDASQIEELIVLGELTQKARQKNVQVIVEGPGHMAINEIDANVKLHKKLCHDAPFYVLGPIVTDVAPGYDHITSAIGGAIAAASGVDFLCYVTPAEHLRLPTLEDMKEGIIASKIAAHAADIAKGVKGAVEWDRKMSTARADINWEEMFSLAMDHEKPRRYRMESMPELEDTCTMCGKICAVRNMNKIMKLFI